MGMVIKQIDPYLRDAEPVECEGKTCPERAEWIILDGDKALFFCSYCALQVVHKSALIHASRQALAMVGG